LLDSCAKVAIIVEEHNIKELEYKKVEKIIEFLDNSKAISLALLPST